MATPAVFRLHPIRVLLLPPARRLAIHGSAWLFVAVSVSVFATLWDAYHSGAQTFGLARIYGNDPTAGRQLD